MAKKVKVNDEIGESGTLIFGGIIAGEEYNSKLSGGRALRVYDEMRRNDGTVKSSLKAVKLPILSASWDIQKGGETPTDELAAKAIHHMLFQAISFESFLRQALGHLDFGYSLFEQVFNYTVYEGNTYIGLEKLAYRKQDTVQSWQMSDGNPGITQYTLTGGTKNIPMEKLVVFTNEKEGDNYEGISILRSAYKHWFLKDTYYKIDAIAQERQGVGFPVIRVPKDAKQEDKNKAREIAKNIRANESSYAELPDGFELEFIDVKGKGTRDITPMILHHDRQISKNVLAQFMEIGAEKSSGSLSASNDQLSLLVMSLETIAKEMAETITNTVVKNLVELNGWNVTSLPKVTVSKIGKDSATMLADAVNKLGTSYITPTLDLENHLRETMKLPKIEEDEYQSNHKKEVNTPDDSTADAATAGELQKQALNGAQIQSLVGILTSLSSGQLPYDSAKPLIRASFPLLTDSQIDEILKPVKKFKPKVEANLSEKDLVKRASDLRDHISKVLANEKSK